MPVRLGDPEVAWNGRARYHQPVVRSAQHLVPAGLLFLCACGGSQVSAPREETLADPVAEGARISYSGLVTLEGSLAEERTGAVVVAVQHAGGGEPILMRAYDLNDPWRSRESIPFGLSLSDRVVQGEPRFARRMTLVARYDADGNPATEGADDVQTSVLVETGSTDTVLVLRRAGREVTRASRSGGQ